MKLCSIGYIPPASFKGATAFYENIRQFKTTHDLILFSEANWPDTVRLKISPEAPFTTKSIGGATKIVKPYKWAIHNILFFTAMQMCRDKGYDYAIYLESDCRVCADHWDDAMFGEMFGMGRPLICAGSLGVYNPANHSPRATRRWCELVSKYFVKKNMMIPTYGWVASDKQNPSCVFPNGALSILSVTWMHDLFDLTRSGTQLTHECTAPFDMAIGERVWRRFEDDAYEVCGHLTCAYSTYGEIITTLDDRKRMLTEKKFVALHHIKEEWRP